MGAGEGSKELSCFTTPHRSQPLAVLVAAAYKARGFGKPEGTVQGQAALIVEVITATTCLNPRAAGQERLVQPATYAAATRRIRSQKDGQLGKIAVACLGPEGFGAA